ncbi:response regulator [Variovorax sp. J2P1-59]|uniref:response regulator n=1 Tax=Variovorax flavidus TaxID=3053501 RepID=UPI002576DD02|nr:response regulator [Variovorax sp. J2P1-59]MDM0074067.1 response regulator [Variovorax sp. J2P1-59]
MNTKARATVAVVDDDLVVLESVSDLLESAGYAALTFSSANALLRGEALQAIDCLISDICMPGLDGWEVMALAHQQRPLLPIILFTADDQAARMTRSMPLARDVHALFRKPFDAQALLSAIADALEPRR